MIETIDQPLPDSETFISESWPDELAALEAELEFELDARRKREILTPAAEKVMATARALSVDSISSKTPLIHSMTSMVVENAVHQSLNSSNPWTQVQFDRMLQELMA